MVTASLSDESSSSSCTCSLYENWGLSWCCDVVVVLLSCCCRVVVVLLWCCFGVAVVFLWSCCGLVAVLLWCCWGLVVGVGGFDMMMFLWLMLL